MDIWTKPILPTVDGHPSYAIGILSHRVDGYPYRLNFTLSELKVSNIAKSYMLKVSDESDSLAIIIIKLKRNLPIEKINNTYTLC